MVPPPQKKPAGRAGTASKGGVNAWPIYLSGPAGATSDRRDSRPVTTKQAKWGLESRHPPYMLTRQTMRPQDVVNCWPTNPREYVALGRAPQPAVDPGPAKNRRVATKLWHTGCVWGSGANGLGREVRRTASRRHAGGWTGLAAATRPDMHMLAGGERVSLVFVFGGARFSAGQAVYPVNGRIFAVDKTVD